MGFRENAQVRIRGDGNKLTPLEKKCDTAPPRNSPAGGVNFPIIYALTVSTAYPDNKLSCEFSKAPPPLVGDPRM